MNELSEKEVLVSTFEQIVQINRSTMKLHEGIHGVKDENEKSLKKSL